MFFQLFPPPTNLYVYVYVYVYVCVYVYCYVYVYVYVYVYPFPQQFFSYPKVGVAQVSVITQGSSKACPK